MHYERRTLAGGPAHGKQYEIDPKASAWVVPVWSDDTAPSWEREMTQVMYYARRFYGQLPGRTDVSMIQLYAHPDVSTIGLYDRGDVAVGQIREAAYADWQAGTLPIKAGTDDPTWIRYHFTDNVTVRPVPESTQAAVARSGGYGPRSSA